MQDDSTDQQTYWTKRTEEQLEMAKKAIDLKVRAIHLDLAAMYAARAEQLQGQKIAVARLVIERRGI